MKPIVTASFNWRPGGPKTPFVTFVTCDTRDQIMQVLDAVRAHIVEEKLDEFAKAAGPKNEPGCLYSDIGPILFGASEHVGVLFDNDRAINLWVSHVGNRRGELRRCTRNDDVPSEGALRNRRNLDNCAR